MPTELGIFLGNFVSNNTSLILHKPSMFTKTKPHLHSEYCTKISEFIVS